MNFNKYLILCALCFASVSVLYPANLFFLAPKADHLGGDWSLIRFNQKDGAGWSDPLITFSHNPIFGTSASGDACFAWQTDHAGKAFFGVVVAQLSPEYKELNRTEGPGLLLRAMGHAARSVTFSNEENGIYFPTYVPAGGNHRFTLNHYNRLNSEFSQIDLPESFNLPPKYIPFFSGIGIFSDQGVYKLSSEFSLKKLDQFELINDIGLERSWEYFTTPDRHLFRFSKVGELQQVFDQTLQLKSRLPTTVLLGRPIHHCLLFSSEKWYFAYTSNDSNGGKTLSILDLSTLRAVPIEGDFDNVVSLSSAPRGNELMLVVEDGEASYIQVYRIEDGKVTREEKIALPTKYSAVRGRLIVAD